MKFYAWMSMQVTQNSIKSWTYSGKSWEVLVDVYWALTPGGLTLCVKLHFPPHHLEWAWLQSQGHHLQKHTVIFGFKLSPKKTTLLPECYWQGCCPSASSALSGPVLIWKSLISCYRKVDKAKWQSMPCIFCCQIQANKLFKELAKRQMLRQ